MDEVLKKTVIIALEQKLGCAVVISHKEWEDAKRDSLNDIYSNKLSFFEEITPEYFIDVMISVLYCARSIPA